MNNIKDVYYLPGSSGNIWATYENYLKDECGKIQINTVFVDFPKQERCTYSEWEFVMKQYLKPNSINEHTIVIARCIGGRFIIKYIADNNVKIKGLICIATAFKNELLVQRDFIQSVLPLFPVNENIAAKAIENIENRIFIFGDHDHLFDKKWLEESAELMKAEKYFIPGLNHCGNKSGKKEFPELIDALLKIHMKKSSKNTGYDNVKSSVIKGGNVAKNAKEQIEKETGKKIVTSSNNKNIKRIGDS